VSTKSTAVATLAGKQSLIVRMADRYGVDPEKFNATLKATAFHVKNTEVSNEQMLALLVVADQYKLNPFTREIYAFPSERGIVPIISVDGWIRMINSHPQFSWMELSYAEDGDDNPWIQCAIQRTDRERPLVVREYMAECKRNTGPWNSHPRRMLRHKAIIQCARIAFGFASVFDPDEGERIVAVTEPGKKPVTVAPRRIERVEVAPVVAAQDQAQCYPVEQDEQPPLTADHG
jgi:phage recombination protein Bet